MRYLLDADWVIDALVDRRGAADQLERLTPSGLAISWITVGEVYEGAFRFPEPESHLRRFAEFLRPANKLGVDEAIVRRFAEIRSLLRRSGNIIGDFDILLGATALEHDLTVLTFNTRHLSRIPGIRIHQF